jgi:hypothetical protein
MNLVEVLQEKSQALSVSERYSSEGKPAATLQARRRQSYSFVQDWRISAI